MKIDLIFSLTNPYLNSFMRWCMCMKRRLRSSIFSSLLADSGALIRKSMRSRKLMRIEWFSLFSSFLRSTSFEAG